MTSVVRMTVVRLGVLFVSLSLNVIDQFRKGDFPLLDLFFGPASESKVF